MAALVQGKYTVESILQTAEQLCSDRKRDSRVVDVDAEAALPRLRTSELELGKVLGRGFFCVVQEVTNIQLKDATVSVGSDSNYKDDRALDNVVQDRFFMQTHCRRGEKRDCRYAIKRLQRSTTTNASDYINGAVDLATEASFLAVLRHPNIIKMRAVAYYGPFSTREPNFLVLDRLYCTLATQLVTWHQQRPNKLLDISGRRRKAFWAERMVVGHDIGCALEYLHKSRIIYRDLKPDNIGFDVRGDVKIFDFGLSKEFDPAQRDHEGMFLFTEAGSPRYMAPEVGLQETYNERVDVYSFAILLWHMLKLEVPFKGFNLTLLKKSVYRGGLRPKCPKNRLWTREICDLLQQGWGDKRHRQSMSRVLEVMRDNIEFHTGHRLTSPSVEYPATASTESRQAGPAESPSFISAINLGYRQQEEEEDTDATEPVEFQMADSEDAEDDCDQPTEDTNDMPLEKEMSMAREPSVIMESVCQKGRTHPPRTSGSGLFFWKPPESLGEMLEEDETFYL